VEEREPEKAWVQPTRSTRTLTIIVFVQSRGNSKAHTKSFLPKHNLKKKKHRGKRTGERVQKSGRQNQKQRKKKQQKRKGITSHRAFIFGVVLHCTAKFPFFAFNKMFEYSVKVI
jgi:ribosome assembly protein YihI (activator of Der GTPase)